MFQTTTINISTIILGFLGSAALGSIISLFGIWRQNKSQDKRQKVAMETEMRREIYFLGAEALGKMQNYLVSFANPLIQDSQQNEIILGVNESLNKVAMIANLEMLQDLDLLQSYYSRSVSENVTRKLDFKSKAVELQSDEQIHANLGQNLAQITAELNSANQRQDIKMQAILISQFKNLDADFKQQENQLRQRRHQMLLDIFEIIENAIEAALKFDELAVPLNCKARSELGFPIDQEKYYQMLELAGNRQRKLAKEWKEEWKFKLSETAKQTPFEVSF